MIEDSNNVMAIILGAGLGTRMKSKKPKVLFEVAGKPMINVVIDSLEKSNIKNIVPVIGDGMEELKEKLLPYKSVIQKERLGTGHAVICAKEKIKDFKGHVLVLFGDSPLIKESTINKILNEKQKDNALVVLGFEKHDFNKYGRLVVGKNGLEKIVEYKDANEEQRKINLCNAGVMCFDAAWLYKALDELDNKNSAGEYYLTDLVEIAKKQQKKCGFVLGEEEETIGANTRKDLAEIDEILQTRLRNKAMEEGASLIDPKTVYFRFDTKIGKDVVIEPNVYFGENVTIEDNVHIKAFSHIEGAVVKAGAIIGPFARLRPQAVIDEDVHIGNFVEIKKATIEKGAKVNHLTYIGDAKVGEKTNVGAGTITCNYDGFNKDFTEIGKNAFIGSNTIMVAPVKIGNGAITAAGSIITKEVDDDSLALSRAEQVEKKGVAPKFRARKKAIKESKNKS